jgi:hypothetical protein
MYTICENSFFVMKHSHPPVTGNKQGEKKIA